MKKILFILSILLSLKSEGQMMCNGTKFILSTLTDMSPTAYTSGTTTLRRKRIQNMSLGTLSGYAIEQSSTASLNLINCMVGPTISNGISQHNNSGTLSAYQTVFLFNRVGVEADANTGNTQLTKCWFLNMWGAGQCKGQALQMSNTTTPDSYFEYCKSESIYAEGYPEDHVSLYTATGTTQPIRVRYNKFRGGGPSSSGGGIAAGDTDGGNQLIDGNDMWEVGNYVWFIASGVNIRVKNNRAYQTNDGVSTILSYVYGGQNGATTCSGHEMSGNSANFWNTGNLFYGGDGSPTEDCGDIIGIGPNYVADPNNEWLETNNNSLTVSSMKFPPVLMDFCSEDQLWQLRDLATSFSDAGGCKNTDQRARPTANAGSDQSISLSIATLTGNSGGTGQRWVCVSGPSVVGIAGSTTTTGGVSGMTNGTYIFRYEKYNGAASDADWCTITVSGL